MTTYSYRFSHLPATAAGMTLAQAVAAASAVIAADGASDPEAEGIEPLAWWQARFAEVDPADGAPVRQVECTYDHDGGEVVVIEAVP